MKTSSSSKKSNQYTHEYLYHHVTSEDVSANNNVIQSYNSSPNCGMKFLQLQVDQERSKESHESPSDSSEHPLEEISTQNGPFNFYSNSMSSCVSQ